MNRGSDGSLRQVQPEFEMRKLIVRMLETICGVFVATLPQLGAVINENEGVVCSTPGDEGRIVQAWVNIVRRLRVSAMTACENHESSVIDGT